MYDAARKFNIPNVSNTLSGGKFRFAPHAFSAEVKVFPILCSEAFQVTQF